MIVIQMYTLLVILINNWCQMIFQPVMRPGKLQNLQIFLNCPNLIGLQLRDGSFLNKLLTVMRAGR